MPPEFPLTARESAMLFYAVIITGLLLGLVLSARMLSLWDRRRQVRAYHLMRRADDIQPQQESES